MGRASRLKWPLRVRKHNQLGAWSRTKGNRLRKSIGRVRQRRHRRQRNNHAPFPIFSLSRAVISPGNCLCFDTYQVIQLDSILVGMNRLCSVMRIYRFARCRYILSKALIERYCLFTFKLIWPFVFNGGCCCIAIDGRDSNIIYNIHTPQALKARAARACRIIAGPSKALAQSFSGSGFQEFQAWQGLAGPSLLILTVRGYVDSRDFSLTSESEISSAGRALSSVLWTHLCVPQLSSSAMQNLQKNKCYAHDTRECCLPRNVKHYIFG